MTELRNDRVLKVVAFATYSILTGGCYLDMLIGWQKILDWVYAHETLATGLLAVGGAMLAAFPVFRQLTLADRHEQQRLQRRKQAVRIATPLAVLGLSTYTELMGKLFVDLYDQLEDGSLPGTVTIDIPPLPDDAISALRDLAETVSATEALFISQLISRIQIQHSVIRSWKERSTSGLLVLELNVLVTIFEAAVVMALANALWAYARWQTSDLPSGVTYGDVLGALRRLDLDGDTHPDVWRLFDGRSDGDLQKSVPHRWTVAT